jgi:hypothetical protein
MSENTNGSKLTVEFLISLFFSAVVTTVMKTSDAFYGWVNRFGIEGDLRVNILASVLGAAFGLILYFSLTRLFNAR